MIIAINGYLEDGYFKPLEAIKLPKRVPATLTYNDSPFDESYNERMEWLESFRSLLQQSAGEELPDFERMRFNREPIDFSDEATP